MNTHTREKPYQCSGFEKYILKNSDLNSHKITHTGKKPHQGSDCGS